MRNMSIEKMLQNLIILALLACLANAKNLTFTNPIFGEYSTDPCILKLGDFYYLTLQNLEATELTIYKSAILTSFRNAEQKVILRVPDGYNSLMPSEMQQVNGELYIHFRMKSQVGYRLFVMKANNPSDPMDGWGEPIRLLNDWDYEAIDGAVMKHNDQLYFVWTNLSTKSSLFIAPMTSPTLVGSPKVLIKEPTEEWECQGRCVNEGSSFLYSKNASYMIFSASVYATPDYCLGQMSIPEGKDPLVPENWKTVDGPVFWRNDDEDVYSTGRSEFTTSNDGTETWMIYHATISPVHIRLRQTARLDKIGWNDDGSPIFPRPLGNHRPRRVPSGQILACV